MSSNRFKSCFISAPLEADTSLLRTALQARNIEWIDATTAKIGISILDSIESAIQNADFVCVVLPVASENRNVLFEMGLTRGMRRPLLIFAEEGAVLPSDLDGVAYARLSITDISNITFHLDLFLQHSKRNPAKKGISNAREKDQIDLPWAQEEIRKLSQLSGIQKHLATENLIAKLFEAIGATVSTGPENGIGADLAVWIDELQPIFGNPLVVEVKHGRSSESRLRDTEQQLATYLLHSHTRAGVIIFEDERLNSDNKGTKWPLIFRYSLKEFFELITTGLFVSDLRAKRNSIVHGDY